METNIERRGSKPRPFERSSSYSAAIGNSYGHCPVQSSIEIPHIVNTEVYNNEDLKNKFRLSQHCADGNEFRFQDGMYNAHGNEIDNDEVFAWNRNNYTSSDESEEEGAVRGLVMKIDVENNNTENSSPSTIYKQMSDASTQPLVSNSVASEDYDSIQPEEEIYSTIPETVASNAHGYSTPYTKRKKTSGRRKRLNLGRPLRSRRVVHKNGDDNVPIRSNIPSKSMKYMRDIVNTIINSKWRFIIILMVVAHFIVWFVFAAIWYAVTISYQDDIGDGKEHCVIGTSSFAGLLMMAVETQMTIGYGVRYPNEECPEAIAIMVMELVAGTAISGALASLLFLKLIRPNRHLNCVGFSKKATVCMRDGQLCVTFRVWDLLNFHIIQSEVTAYMLKPIRTLEGEFVQNFVHQLPLQDGKAFLLWPVTIVHVIDCNSPLYDFSAQDMMDYRFEIIVCLTGSSKNMGTVAQSRTSYLSKEIIWGHRFKNVLNYSKEADSYIIDVDNLDTTEQVDTPLCSASQLKEFQQDILPEDTPSPVSKSPPSLVDRGSKRSYGWNYKKLSPGSDRIPEVRL